MKADLVVRVFDLEANNLYPAVDKIWCGAFSNLEGSEKISFGPDQLDLMIAYMDGCDVLIGHNVIGYDFPTLKKVLHYEFKGKVVDTLIMSRLLNPKRTLPATATNRAAGPHSIYAWGVRVGVDKPDHDDWSQYSNEMQVRCEADTEINRLVYHRLIEEAEKSGGRWKEAFLLSFKLFQNLQEQEEYGWYMDQQAMHDNIATLTKMMQDIDDEVIPQLPYVVEVLETKTQGEYNYVRKPYLKSGKLNRFIDEYFAESVWHNSVAGPFTRIMFRRVDINSRNETVAFLLAEGWEPLEWNYNDERERTSPKLSKDDPFEGIEGNVGKLVAKRVQCRHRRSLVEGLFELLREDGRIASSIAGVAVTGRMQHRGIVNIPAAKSFFGAELRRMFSCPVGKVLVSTDSDGNQVRQLCARMNDPDYTFAVVNGDKDDGTDIHSVNMRAAQLPDRDSAKTFFYGFLFGAGDGKIGKIVKSNAARGKQLKEDFLSGLPALKSLLERLRAEWRKTARRKYNPRFNDWEYFDGIITGLDGRPIKIGSEHQILVYLLQSDEAIQMSAAYNMACAVLKKKFKWLKQVAPVCFYHDEFTFECDEDIAAQVKKISEEAIAWAGRFYKISCPHVGQGKIGKNWYEVH